MKEMRRVLALVLCFVMLVGMLPAGALAAENETEPVTLVTEAPTDPAGQAQNEDSEGNGQGQSEEPTQQPTEKPADEPTGDAADDAADDAAGDVDGDAAGDADDDAAGAAPGAGEQDPTDAAPTEAPSEPEEIAVTGITLDRTELEVGVGELPIQLVATVLPEDATDKTVTWESSEPGVVDVDKNGLLTFGYMGKAVITATAGEFTAECKVTVDEGEGDTYDGITYVLAGSDFQPSDDKIATGTALVNGLLTKIQADYPVMHGFLFAGDYENASTGNATESKNGKDALQAEVQKFYSGMDEVYVQGNHDPDSLVGSTLAGSGANDAANYGVYVINEKDYMWYNDSESTIKNTASALDRYLDAKVNEKYDDPIFVVSHLPLHYNMRTKQDGDGQYANYIFDVLNEAGKAGLNIIFLFGHNHSHGWDDYLGGSAIFLTKGDKINIAQGSKDSYQEETLNFTYMNAGYVAYYRNVNSGAETDLSMTVFAITDNTVTIERYTKNGPHALKSVGVKNAHAASTSYVSDGGSGYCRHGLTEPYGPNTSTVASPYTLTLNTSFGGGGGEGGEGEGGETGGEEENTPVTLTDEPTGISVSALNITALNVGVVEFSQVAAAVEGLLEGNPVAYDITVDGFENGTATVSFPIPEGMAADRFAVYHVDGAEAEKMEGEVKDGAYVFKTDHFSTYVGGEIALAAEEGNVAEGSLAGNAYTQQIMNKSELETGVGYLIVADQGNDITLTGTKASGSNRLVLSGEVNASNQNLWYWDGSDHLLYGSPTPDNNYLNITYSGNWLSSTSTASLGGNGNNTVNTITGHGDGVFSISVGNRTYLNRNGGTSGTDAGGYNSNNAGSKWKIYKVVNENGSAVKLTVDPSSVSLMPNGTETLMPTVLVDGTATTNYKLTYSSSDTTKVSVTDTGVITGVEDGSATITVTLTEANGKKANGTIEVEIPVAVVSRDFEIIGVAPMMGAVVVNSVESAGTGSLLTIKYTDNGETATIPVTLGMLSGEELNVTKAGFCKNLIVTYGGKTITGYTLEVLGSASVNNYPEYPNQGSVRVNKTGTGVDFQSSGIAQVEISATGLPAGKGVDVVVVIDTSSSMEDNYIGSKRRIQVLSESLKGMLDDFQNPNADTGVTPDVDIAIIDFNGYGSNTYVTGASLNNSYRTDADYAKVYTGTTAGSAANSNNLSAASFVKSTTINSTTMAANFNASNCHSGTNYDGALHDAYELLKEKKAANEAAGVEREQFVIFLSDGAPYRYNGFNNQYSGYTNWNKWLSGDWSTIAEVNAVSSNDDYTYFYNGNGTNHPHRVAEAIKGSGTFTVIGDRSTGSPYTMEYEGLGATIYAIGFGLADDKSSYSNGGTVTKATQMELIRTISSGEGFYNDDVTEAEELENTFKNIVKEIALAATNARFVDQMGDDYNLQLENSTYTVVENGAETEKTLAPVIEILSYDIYTMAEAGKIPEGKNIGDRKGTSSLKEVVKFSDDGTKAYSNLIDVDKDGIYGVTVNTDGTYTITDEEDNILNDGVISATNFWYNTTSSGVAVTGVSIPTGKNAANLTTGSTDVLPAETFYWNMGTINTSELAMRYYVYLDGSMEGTRPGGSYPTNEYATLYYDNYLENHCYKETVSPVMAWKEANVSYAFYLVNENGEIIVNQTTGQTGTFANKIAVTNPVVYKTVLLNNEGNVQAITVADVENNILPLGYELYDEGAEYEVTIMSNTTGRWEITNGDKPVNTTYVTQYKTDDASAYSNALTNNTVGDDYTHTVVWFAVLWKVQALPDSVVIDYGLPVDISVLTNDMFGENGKLAGVGAISDSLNLDGHTATMDSGFANEYKAVTSTEDMMSYGDAVIDTDTGKVRYTLNTMEMNGYDKFAYAVNYTGTTNPGYYYDTVTVIPATTIYYEDEFLTYEYHYSGEGTSGPGWVDEGTAIEGATQAEDRPGQFSLTDANNIYGYDAVNNGMSTFSLGTAKKVHVDADSYATAAFTFYGTGFDVISMTSNTTGTLAIKVTAAEDIVVNGETVYVKDEKVKSVMVNTYYGYNYVDGEWVADPDTKNALYQVPVMQIEELPYGKYDVVITATYASTVDNTTADGYDLYLDAIRIYDPANDGAEDNDNVIEDAYVKDHEGWPSYIELRNNIIAAEDGFGNNDTDTKVTGMVFIDGDAEVGNDQMDDYKSYGPNNEVYLAAGQSVAFMISDVKHGDKSIVDQIHIGMKSANGGACTYKIFNIAKAADSENNVAAGQKYHEKTAEISTATDMYYDITGYRNDIVVIQNTGSSGILSLTNIKTTYTADPNAAVSGSASDGEDTAAAAQTVETEPVVTYLYMTKAAATLTVDALNGKFDEDTTPEATEPEATEPEATEPEVTEPEATEPEVTEPEITEPEATEPEVTEPEETEPEETEPEAFEPEISVKLNKSSVKVGQKVQVKVTTSRDVAYLTVNGETITRYSTNRKTGERTWSTNVTAKEAGSMSITVTAYSDSDIAAEPVVKTVNVTKKANSLLGSLLGSILEWIFG